MKWFKMLLLGMVAHLGMFSILFNSRGETGDGGAGAGAGAGAAGSGSGAGAEGGEPKKLSMTQAEVDSIVESRLRRERDKYGDYEDLKKFKTEHETNADEKKQEDLESQQEYEKLKQGWEGEKGNYTKALTEKDQTIRDLKVEHSLGSIISKLNAYPEATQLLKSQVVFSTDGVPQMKGKDSVGNETFINLEEGAKKFLEERPYLIKASSASGGGTSPSGGGGEGSGSETLDDLNKQLAAAQKTGDAKLVKELKVKVQADLAGRGVKRYV